MNMYSYLSYDSVWRKQSTLDRTIKYLNADLSKYKPKGDKLSDEI